MIKIKNNDKDVQFIEKSKDVSHMLYNEQTLQESNVIKDVINNLDSDVVDKDTNLTSIDFNTRLNDSELGSIVALQMLHTLNVGGSACSLLARSVKRHKVSLKGLGRTEKVQIIQGEREHTENKDSSLFGKVKGFLGGNNEK